MLIMITKINLKLILFVLGPIIRLPNTSHIFKIDFLWIMAKSAHVFYIHVCVCVYVYLERKNMSS